MTLELSGLRSIGVLCGGVALDSILTVTLDLYYITIGCSAQKTCLLVSDLSKSARRGDLGTPHPFCEGGVWYLDHFSTGGCAGHLTSFMSLQICSICRNETLTT